MDFLCKVCDRSVIENPSEYNKYIATLRKENNRSFYINYTINNFNLDEFDKILYGNISPHKNKFDLF